MNRGCHVFGIMGLLVLGGFLLWGCGDSVHNKNDADQSQNNGGLEFGVGDYPNADLLVSGEALEASLGQVRQASAVDDDSDFVLIDARGAGYDTAHIPGAISLTWDEFGAPNLSSVSELEDVLTNVGITRDMTIVIYDDTTASWGAAGRIFWTLEYLGCTDVHILQGGWDKWVADGRPTETTANALPEAPPFEANVNADVSATKEHIRDRRQEDDFAVIDSRTDKEFIGWVLYDEARGGHMKGAIHIPYEWFFNEDKTILGSEDLMTLFESRGITSDKEVTSYCTVGIRSGFVYFALRLMGYSNCSNYDGSISDWAVASVDDPDVYPMEQEANYQKLVYPGWVKSELIDGGNGGKPYVIVEVSWGAAGAYYNDGHIPGAIHVNTDEIEYDCFNARNDWPVDAGEPACWDRSTTEEEDAAKGLGPDDSLPRNWWNIYPDEYLLPAIAYMGIDKNTTVVVYGRGFSAAARIVWTLMYAGVEDVRLLNGGNKAWTAAGYALETTANERTPVDEFDPDNPGATSALHPEYLVNTAYVRQATADPNSVDPPAVIADIRRWEEYIGASRPYSYIPTDGRVAGALWGHNTNAFTDADGTLRSYTEVEALWAENGITSNRSVSFYCGTAWRSSMAWFLAYLMGWENISNFDNSWFEWSMGEGSAYNGDDPVLNPIIDSSPGLPTASMENLASYIQEGATEEGAEDRVLIVDTRSSADYIEGHIQDALNVPYELVSENGAPLYTNGYDEVSPTASNKLADSWMAHLLINQLVNDFVTTYQDSQIIFYGDDAGDVTRIAKEIGYGDVTPLEANYDQWAADYPDLTEAYGPGVVSVDEEGGSFVFTGLINNTNYENVSTRATHHGMAYKGGGLSGSSFLHADIPPFCFQELLTYLGASPEGNMADGIYFGDMSEWGSKYPDGQRVNFEVTWEGADGYYTLAELYEEQPSEFDPNPAEFTALGIEPRIGGTRDSNLNWNPGCIFCFYACVCGITSNARANEDTWFADGGIYDVINFPDDPRNYYAGRYYPKSELMPGEGEAIQIKVTIGD